MRRTRWATGSTCRYAGTVTVLGHRARPQFVASAQTLEHVLQAWRGTSGVAGKGQVATAVRALRSPLGAPEDQIDFLFAAGHTNTVNTTTIGQCVTGCRNGARVCLLI